MQVSAFAMRQSTTPYHLLLAAFALTISRACRQTDIVISSSLSNCVLPLRFQLGSISSVGQLLSLTQQVLGAALAHGDMPFQRLMEELDLPRTTAYMPFFQAAITIDDAGEPRSFSTAPEARG
jgi:non-ribosomal peptide synthetase component F